MANTKRKIATTTAASFGAALGSIYLAPELQADILDITWNGGSPTATHAWSSGTFNPGAQNIDQLSGTPAFNQYNDEFNGGNGRTFFLPGDIASATIVLNGSVLDPNTFAGATGNITASNFAGTGSLYIGFSDSLGNVGWFQMSFVNDGAITYGAGEYGSMGESVTVGGSGAIPEPSSLGALALLAVGAAGIRRKRNVA